MSDILYINSSTVVDSTTNTILFSSIPQNYSDLIITWQAGETANAGVYPKFNSDTGTNYSRYTLYGNGTASNAVKQVNVSTAWIIGANITLSNTLENTGEIQIFGYSSSSIYKTWLVQEGSASNGVSTSYGVWKSNSAITQLEIICASTDKFTSGSSFILWGIK